MVLKRALLIAVLLCLLQKGAWSGATEPTTSSLFVRQPVVPIGNPSMVDHLPPPAVAAASDALAQVKVSADASFTNQSGTFHTVSVSRVLFSHRSIPSKLVVQTGSELLLPSGIYVMSLTAIPTDSPVHAIAPYRLTWRVTGVGEIISGVLTFRSKLGPDYSYPVNDRQSWIGCFYLSPANRCRAALLGRYRITSSQQRRVFGELLKRSPFAGLLWTQIAITTSQRFPTALCAAGAVSNCASLERFEQTLHFRPSD